MDHTCMRERGGPDARPHHAASLQYSRRTKSESICNIHIHEVTSSFHIYASCLSKLTSPQSNMRRARRKGLIGYNGTPKFTPKTAPSLRRSPPPSNTPIPRLTQLTTPNGIRIQSAVLPQYTLRTDRQTDGLDDRPVP